VLNTILFDLDGTLLPMDADRFEKVYFNEMAGVFTDLISPKELVANIWASTKNMVANLEYRTNEEVFMEDFEKRIAGDIKTYQTRFDAFYDHEYLKAEKTVFKQPLMKKSVSLLKEKGYQVVVATNPLFPLKAIHHRIRWAGFTPEDFSYISCYEYNHYCKPQLKYYEEILENIGKKPKECLMVGNDVQEDLVAGKLGLKTFFIKDYMLHRTNEEICSDYMGSYEDFYRFVKELPVL
jgi:FMN phosphatase YigB (HAD superfamily)